MSDRTYIIDTLQKLIRINSVNPELETTGPGEEEIGKYISDELSALGVDVEIQEVQPGRFNVIGIISGSGGGKSLMLNAHMDTVGVSGMQNPFSGKIENGRLYGRGSYDMKGSIAAILATAKKLTEKNIRLSGELILSFVVDEEFESIGARELVKKYKTDSAIVTEPSDLNVCLAHRGFGVFKIVTHGKIAHGGKHREGIDANLKMGLILAELNQLANQLPDRKKHALCGEASLHVPLIEGGKSLFIYSDECTAHVERRTLPGESESEVLGEFEQILQKCKANDEPLRTTVESVIWRNPYEIERDRPIVQSLMKSAQNQTGRNPKFIGHTWWEDSAIFGQADIETVIFGPKGGGIHEETEWVEIDSVVQLSDVLWDVVFGYCK